MEDLHTQMLDRKAEIVALRIALLDGDPVDTTELIRMCDELLCMVAYTAQPLVFVRKKYT